MKSLRLITVSAMLVVLGCGNAFAAKKMVGDPKAGADKSAVCQGCHGGDGNSQDATFPRLAGQYANYIAKQVKDFQTGKRANNDTMAGMAATVTSDQDLKDIAAYFSSKNMAKKPLVAIDKKLAAKGEKIFKKGLPKKGVYACINCHGPRGKGRSGKNSVFPRIGGQHRDYIIKELKDLRSAKRSNDPAGMMRGIAKKLSDADIKGVATYLSAQLP